MWAMRTRSSRACAARLRLSPREQPNELPEEGQPLKRQRCHFRLDVWPFEREHVRLANLWPNGGRVKPR